MWDLSARGAGSAATPDRGARRRPPVRRVLAIGLGLGAVVTTGAVAQACVYGNGGSQQADHQVQAAQLVSEHPTGTWASWNWTMPTSDTVHDGLFGALCKRPTRGDGDGDSDDRQTGWSSGSSSDDSSSGWTKGSQPPASWQSDWPSKATSWSSMFGQHWWSHRLSITPFADRTDPTFNQTLGINDRGVVVGYYGSGADAMHPNKGYVVKPPYRQRNDVHVNVPGSVQTQEIGIDDLGVQVGFSIDQAGTTSGFVRFGDAVRSVHNPLSAAKPAVDQLLGINNRGIAGGFYDDAMGASHGYLFNVCTGEFAAVDIPAAHDSLQVTGVNDLGVVSGLYTEGKVTRGFVLDHGRFSSIDLGNKAMTQAFGLDDAGDVVGSFVDSHGATRGFVWQHGHVRVVDVPHATGGTVVNGVNNRGQLVGFFTTSDKRTIGFIAS